MHNPFFCYVLSVVHAAGTLCGIVNNCTEAMVPLSVELTCSCCSTAQELWRILWQMQLAEAGQLPEDDNSVLLVLWRHR